MINAGLIHRVSLCREPSLPLKSYEDLNIFKIYGNDIGLLRVQANLPPGIFHRSDNNYKEFKGALAENYILQSLLYQYGQGLCYWSSGNQAEVDFLLQTGTSVIPIEVKSGTSIRGKSLIEYGKKYSPKLRLRYSMQNLKYDGNLLNMPLFLADRTSELIDKLPSFHSDLQQRQ